jgi:serine protease Do
MRKRRWLVMSRCFPRNGLIALIVIAGLVGVGVVGFSRHALCDRDKPAPQAAGERSSDISSDGYAVAQQLSEAFEAATAKVNSSVVPIFAEQIVDVRSPFAGPTDPFRDFFGDDFFRRFFSTPQGGKQTVRSLGSGVIVSSDGYVLTNNHVVSRAEKLTVMLSDDKKYDARVVGTDPQSDVAVLKIDADGLPAAKLGDSDSVKVGQWVIAVGNPFQLMHTVTAGIISAKGRSQLGLADYEDFIQTDASINPGNSGGALADLAGRVVGINTAINSPTGGSVGIGFAIPINMAKKVMETLISEGKVTRGFMGILPQDIDENLLAALKLKSMHGSLVGDVTAGGPADKAGIKRGDVITALDGREVEGSNDLRNMVAQAKPDARIQVTLIRDGKERDITVVLGERPGEAEAAGPATSPEESHSVEKLGLSLQDLTPDIASQLGYEDEKGVLVAAVAGGTAAEEAGLERGDLIQEVDRAEVQSVKDFQKEIGKLASGDSVALLVRRGQNTFFRAIVMP